MWLMSVCCVCVCINKLLLLLYVYMHAFDACVLVLLLYVTVQYLKGRYLSVFHTVVLLYYSIVLCEMPRICLYMLMCWFMPDKYHFDFIDYYYT